MGMRKLGDTIILDFTTHNPVTGFVQNADSLPTCEVFADNNDTAILTPTVINRVRKTGDYRVSIEATSGNGFVVGSSYNVVVSVIVNSVPAKGRIGSFTLDSKRNADLQDLAQSQILSDGTPFQGASIDTIKQIEVGRWKILNNQLILYANDGVTPLKVFDLKDKDGLPTEINVYERVPE